MAVERGVGEGGPDTREVNPRHATLATTAVHGCSSPGPKHSGNAAANASVARNLRGRSQGSPGALGGALRGSRAACECRSVLQVEAKQNSFVFNISFFFLSQSFSTYKDMALILEKAINTVIKYGH